MTDNNSPNAADEVLADSYDDHDYREDDDDGEAQPEPAPGPVGPVDPNRERNELLARLVVLSTTADGWRPTRKSLGYYQSFRKYCLDHGRLTEDQMAIVVRGEELMNHYRNRRRG